MLPSKPPPPRNASLLFQPLVGSLAWKRSAESANLTSATHDSGCGALAAATAAAVTRAAPLPSVLPASAAQASAGVCWATSVLSSSSQPASSAATAATAIQRSGDGGTGRGIGMVSPG